MMDGLGSSLSRGLCYVLRLLLVLELPPCARDCFPGDYRQLFLSNSVSFGSVGN